jgi:hypothetical protein
MQTAKMRAFMRKKEVLRLLIISRRDGSWCGEPQMEVGRKRAFGRSLPSSGCWYGGTRAGRLAVRGGIRGLSSAVEEIDLLNTAVGFPVHGG